MTPEELAAIREAHVEDPRHQWCSADDMNWPCDTARLVAHIDAITKAVEVMRPEVIDDGHTFNVTRRRVLTLLRGIPL